MEVHQRSSTTATMELDHWSSTKWNSTNKAPPLELDRRSSTYAAAPMELENCNYGGLNQWRDTGDGGDEGRGMGAAGRERRQTGGRRGRRADGPSADAEGNTKRSPASLGLMDQ